MGTHSHIFLRVKKLEKLITYCKLYTQFDGCIEGVGKDLIKFLANKKLINGISFLTSEQLKRFPSNFISLERRLQYKKEEEESANGIDCLYAQVVSYFKKGVGGVYLVDPTDVEEEEWNYYVDGSHDIDVPITISITGPEEFHFSGTVQEAYEKFVLKKDEDAAEVTTKRAGDAPDGAMEGATPEKKVMTSTEEKKMDSESSK